MRPIIVSPDLADTGGAAVPSTKKHSPKRRPREPRIWLGQIGLAGGGLVKRGALSGAGGSAAPGCGGARPRWGGRRRVSAQVVEDPLDVLVLLKQVHELQDLGGLLFGQLDRGRGDLLGLGRARRDLAFLQRPLELAEVGEAAAQ